MSRFESSNNKQIANINASLGTKANQSDLNATNQNLTLTLISQMIPSQTSIPLRGLTIGNFIMPFTYVTLDTITLG